MKIFDPSFLRSDLISILQAEERERQWHYTQLELISQKIRNIPLTSAQSVSTISRSTLLSTLSTLITLSLSTSKLASHALNE